MTSTEHPTSKQAEVIIIGGGIVGCSIAYHLTKLGIFDVLLLERQKLTSGTTWHAAGLVGTLWPTKNLTELGVYSQELYQTLEAETGQATGFKRTGSLSLATNEARLEELRRSASMGRIFGVEVTELDVTGVSNAYPGINTDDVLGGLYLPHDAQTNPIDTTMALAKGARVGGAEIREDTVVDRLLIEDGRATGVMLRDGTKLRADTVVLAGGMWSRDLARAAGVSVPLYACEHFYVVTEEIPNLPKFPILRDLDNGIYIKEDAGKLLIGFFEHDARSVSMERIPDDFCFDELASEFEHFEPHLEKAMARVPFLETAGIRTFFNGPESFTPDNQPLLGAAPNLPGLFLACGLNSKGISGGGGIGKLMANWIRDGQPGLDIWEVDIRRTMPEQGEEDYLSKRVPEALGHTYAIHWPFYQYESARGVRRSAIHEQLKERGACFGEAACWERANWFAEPGSTPKYEYSYGPQNWFENSAAEHKAIREGVGLYDVSSFAKFRVKGPDALAVLQKVSGNDIDVAPGRLVYTQWLNERAGIEADLTIARMGEDEFAVLTGCGSHVRDLTWLKRHSADAKVDITDVTHDFTVLALQGPKSRDVMERLTDADVSAEAMPFSTAKYVEINGAQVWIQRISYVGELGWEVLIPVADAVNVLEEIERQGAAFDLKLCGLHAVNNLRMEKGFRHFGHDIGEDDTPLEAGLRFACAMDKPDGFIGKEALARQIEQGVPQKRMLSFLLNDAEPMLYHNEPIIMNGEYVGYLTSGGYAHHFGASIGLGYVVQDAPISANMVSSARFEIEVAGVRHAAQASLRPIYDPKATRMNG